MTEFGPNDASIHVFCFKEGVLAKVAHDLKLRAAQFKIDADENFERVCVEVRSDSLEVVSTMKDGRETRSMLTKKDFGKIEDNVRKAVLLSKRHPTIRFESTEIEAEGEGLAITGEISFFGNARPLRVTAADAGDAYEADFWLNQPDYGIKPFTAMMGTLKIKPDVRIVVRIPKP